MQNQNDHGAIHIKEVQIRHVAMLHRADEKRKLKYLL